MQPDQVPELTKGLRRVVKHASISRRRVEKGCGLGLSKGAAMRVLPGSSAFYKRHGSKKPLLPRLTLPSRSAAALRKMAQQPLLEVRDRNLRDRVFAPDDHCRQSAPGFAVICPPPG